MKEDPATGVETVDVLSAKVQKEIIKAAHEAAETSGGSLYAKRLQIYPKDVSGVFRRFKWAALVVLLGIYYIAPWIRWDRGPGVPDQALLVDMMGQRAYFFWLETWPQEIYYLAGLLILAAVGLFLATSLFGRVWCGFACPQTVWTDLFMWVERRVEGDRNARIKLDEGPLTLEKVMKKIAKHSGWLVISLLTGGAWIMYFTDAPTLVHNLVHFQAGQVALFFIGLFTATTYVLGGIAREQVCTYMCPWPRFQAAMLDEDSMIVTYEAWRGEPRGKHKAGTDWEGRGHCVDCNQCVAVCPTGIDIRDGNQLECIGCGLCIDACNHVMGIVKLPRELITYDTISCSAARAEGRPTRYRLVRPRTLIYSGLFVVVGLVMLGTLLTRASFDVNVVRDRNPLYVTLSDGAIRNGYTVKILNKSRESRSFELVAHGLSRAELSLSGQEALPGALALTAQPDSVTSYRIFLRAPEAAILEETTVMALSVTETGQGETVTHESVFRGPAR